MKVTKFKVGDQVEILIGDYLWSRDPIDDLPLIKKDDDGMYLYDMSPEKVGEKDIITKAGITQGASEYELKENGAWYHDSQLKLIYRPRYKE